MNNKNTNDELEFERLLRSVDPVRNCALTEATEKMRATWRLTVQKNKRQRQLVFGLCLAATVLIGVVSFRFAASRNVSRIQVAEQLADRPAKDSLSTEAKTAGSETRVSDVVTHLPKYDVLKQKSKKTNKKDSKQEDREELGLPAAIEWAVTINDWDKLSVSSKQSIAMQIRLDPKQLVSMLDAAAEFSEYSAKRRAVNLAVEALGPRSESMLVHLFRQPSLSVAAWEVAVANANEKGLIQLARLADQETSRRLIAKRFAEMDSDKTTRQLLELGHKKQWLASLHYASQFLSIQQRERLTLAIASASEKERVSIGFVLASIHDPRFDVQLQQMVVRGWYRQEALQVLMFRQTPEAIHAIREFQQDPQLAASVFSARRVCGPQLQFVRHLTQSVPDESSLLHIPSGEPRNDSSPRLAV